MGQGTYRVLFLCTGNSARSIMAEAMLNRLGEGRFEACSAGSHPNGVVNPLSLETLKALDVPVTGLRSKSWDEFARAGDPRFDFVITVCDDAAREACPVWPGAPVTAHWGVPDPAAVEGPEEKRRAAFRDAALTLRRRIELLLGLPVAKLDRSSLRARLREIGTQ
jgi:protein-tyrosine-phosphatase